MLKKSSWWLIVLVSVVAVGFLVTGCSKKAVVKEEVAARPAPVVEAKKVEPPPPPMAPPKEEPKVEPPPPPPPPPAPKVEAAPPAAPAVEQIDLVSLRVQFAFDDYSLSGKAKENLEKLAAWLKKAGSAKIQIEGHACELGTNEYNLALGERRANSTKTYLEGLGIGPVRLSTISYGEERPLDPGHTEDSRSKNRRAEFVMIK